MTVLLTLGSSGSGTEIKKTVLREYLNYSLPVDLRNMVTMTDADISQALGTPLVRMGPEGTIVSGLARSWDIDPKNEFIDFHLDSKGKWSDGSPITAADVVASFRDSRAHFQKTLASVFESYTKMEEVKPGVVRVYLRTGVTPLAFLPKLIEPMFGIVKIVDWSASTKITSGPYSVESVDEKEMILSVNPYWIFHSPEMISEIHLRRTTTFASAETLLKDAWPDMVNLITGVTKEELAKLPPGYSTFRMNHDRLLNLRYVGYGNLEAARAVFAYLRAHADFQKIADLFDGGILARQIFPSGFPLHGKDPGVSQFTRKELLQAWKQPIIRIAYSSSRLQPEIVKKFEELLRGTLPIPVEFTGLTQKAVNEIHIARKFDFTLGSVGVDNDNLDGAMSFYIEQQPVYFPSDKTSKGNFVARLKQIRQGVGSQQEGFRQILFDVVNENYFLPIAHFSTTFVARKGIDFSHVPKFGEMVPFSAIRRND